MANTMIIKVVAVEVGTAKSAKGKDYTFVEVTYKNKTFQDKPETKKHNQYGDQNVFKVLKAAQSGEIYTITREKDANGYWQWVGITEGEDAAPAAPAAAPKGNPAPKSTYETPEERAKKQVYIVRQSSINAAIEFLNHNNKNYKLLDVIDAAKVFEGYVFGTDLTGDTEPLPVFDMDDDLPM